jgi:CDP-diacylglycerol--glycerol-3-phosphate 3-phosphatidyltransferase
MCLRGSSNQRDLEVSVVLKKSFLQPSAGSPLRSHRSRTLPRGRCRFLPYRDNDPATFLVTVGSAMSAPTPAAPEPLIHGPNLLSFARIPLAVVLFACIVQEWWLAALIIFLIATATDWLDGWWARKYGPLTLVGRNLDPLADKVLVCGAFIYLIPVPQASILPWMVTVVVCRELLVTGIRGMVEAAGKKFGADWFGKLKMGLQCAVLSGVFLIAWLRTLTGTADVLAVLEWVQLVVLWAMLVATVGSGVQYVVKAAKLLR